MLGAQGKDTDIRRLIAGICAVLGIALIASACTQPAPGLTRNATGPVHEQPFADPFVLKEGATYHAWATGYTNWPFFRIAYTASSGGIHDWSDTVEAMPTPASWARDGAGANYWAPSVIRRGDGKYLMYFTAQTKNFYAVVNGKAKGPVWCIGVAIASAPQGPYADARGTPLVCQHQLFGSIDPDVFQDPKSGHLHLLWKSEGHGVGVAPRIWQQRLTSSGVSVTGSATTLVSPYQTWEGTVLENPAMVHRDGAYWLFFSGNDWWTTRYGTGVAHCAGPAGPCTRSWSNAMLRTQRNVAGPGGAVPVRGQSNLLAFAAWHPGAVGYEIGGERRMYFVNWYTWGGAPYAL